MKKLFTTSIAIFFCANISAQVDTLPSPGADQIQPDNSADTSGGILERIAENQLNRQQLSFLTAPIKNRSELEVYLSNNEIASTPLRYLPKDAVKPFLDSLVFTEQGLASFRYVDLKGKLSPFEAYELLSLFGAERFAASIYDESQTVSEADKLALEVVQSDGDKDWFVEDYACTDRATCSSSLSDLCTNNC